MDLSISTTLNRSYPDERGNATYTLKLQRPDLETNVWVTEAELALISNVKAAHWSERTSLKIGTCAGMQVFWSCENGYLSILVGEDDETWDFGLWIPETEIDNIIAEIERQKKSEDLYYDEI